MNYKEYKDKFMGKPKVRFDCMSCQPYIACDEVEARKGIETEHSDKPHSL